MPLTISVLNKKGGVGKTSTCHHVAGSFAKRRQRVLLIDNDPLPLPKRAVVLTSNAPAAAIVDYAAQERIDLIVAGTHGRGGVAHLLMGSVAERIVRTAPCPVLTVRHPEHEFVIPDALVAVAKA